ACSWFDSRAVTMGICQRNRTRSWLEGGFMKALIDWLAAVAGKERAVEERRSGFVLVDKTPPAPVTEVPHEPPAPPPISDEELHANHPGQLPIRQASRSYSNESPLVALLYRLMRDDVTPGVMEGA